MDDIESKLERLLDHLLDRKVDEVYINENDDFVIVFDDNTLIELFSEDGDLGIYFEIGQEDKPQLH